MTWHDRVMPTTGIKAGSQEKRKSFLVGSGTPKGTVAPCCTVSVNMCYLV